MWRRTPTDRESVRRSGRPPSSGGARRAAAQRRAATIAGAREPEPVRRRPAEVAGARTPAHSPAADRQRAAAPGSQRAAPGSQRAADRTQAAAVGPLHSRAAGARPQSQDPPSPRTDSFLPVPQSVPEWARTPRDRGAEQATPRALPVDHTPETEAARAVRLVARVARAVARTAEDPAARAVERPKPEEGRAAEAGPRARVAERRMRAGALPRRAGCRKTGKTCWWADSTRHTACTRSCENSQARAMPAHFTRPSAGEHTRFTALYAVKGARIVRKR